MQPDSSFGLIFRIAHEFVGMGMLNFCAVALLELLFRPTRPFIKDVNEELKMSVLLKRSTVQVLVIASESSR